MANHENANAANSAGKRARIIDDKEFQRLLKEFTEKHRELFHYVIGKCGMAPSMSIMYGIHLTLGSIERGTLEWIDMQERQDCHNDEKKPGID